MAHRVPASRCPSCKQLLDGAFCPSEPERTPQKGDWSVCARCLAVLEHDEHGDWREVSEAEIEALPPSDRLDLSHMITTLGLVRLMVMVDEAKKG